MCSREQLVSQEQQQQQLGAPGDGWLVCCMSTCGATGMGRQGTLQRALDQLGVSKEKNYHPPMYRWVV
jgi:hypothetical protein